MCGFQKMKIAIASDLPSFSTGYGQAAHGLAKYLMRELNHSVCFIGLQHGGSPLYHRIDNVKGSEPNYLPVYAGNTQMNIDRSIREIKPDVIIHIRDAFAHVQKYFPTPYTLMGRGARVLLWVPVQGAPLPQEFIDACNTQADIVITLTEWGRNQLLFQGVTTNRLHSAIPIGYDPEVWYPRKVRKEDYGFSPDRKLIGSVGINDQYRKGWPLLIKAASIALKKKKIDLDLYLHTSELGAFDLPAHARAFGFTGHLLFPASYDKGWGVDVNTLAEIVSCFDIYASASIAEGQSVPLLEAAAAGKPLVVSDLPVFREVFGDHATYVTTYQLYPATWSMDYVIDPQDMAEKFASVLSNPPSDNTDYIQNYSWPSLMKKWEKALEELS